MWRTHAREPESCVVSYSGYFLRNAGLFQHMSRRLWLLHHTIECGRSSCICTLDAESIRRVCRAREGVKRSADARASNSNLNLFKPSQAQPSPAKPKRNCGAERPAGARRITEKTSDTSRACGCGKRGWCVQGCIIGGMG